MWRLRYSNGTVGEWSTDYEWIFENARFLDFSVVIEKAGTEVSSNY